MGGTADADKKRATPYGEFQGLIIKAFKCGKLKNLKFTHG